MAFNFIPFLIQLAVSVTLTVAAYLIMPRPKTPKPEVRDMENPTVDAGRSIPVLFGTKEISGVNILWYGEKNSVQYKVKA
jgi:hypothetical protein